MFGVGGKQHFNHTTVSAEKPSSGVSDTRMEDAFIKRGDGKQR